MFMMSIRLRKMRLLIGALAVVLVVALGVTGVNRLLDEKTVDADTTAQSSTASVKPKKVTAKTNEDRLKFIGAYGWEAEEEPAEVLEVIIPEKFDEVYERYNSMQKMQEFDLEKYAGKRCKRYSYVVTNYPGADSEVRINLLVHKNKVIGGDVCSLDSEGFIHGFSIPS